MSIDRNVRVETPETHVRPGFRISLKPFLAALGMAPSEDLLPELSQWRRRRVRAA
ncbi:MAG: hypothetical protein JO040_09270 [Gemmatimonadetes bacterium]|nr:hypothetical protein [Gemmatimonadota bacterium]